MGGVTRNGKRVLLAKPRGYCAGVQQLQRDLRAATAARAKDAAQLANEAA
jgi:4-hydroxy-3-methylbut-2-enyl diphosphate reductase IspH